MFRCSIFKIHSKFFFKTLHFQTIGLHIIKLNLKKCGWIYLWLRINGQHQRQLMRNVRCDIDPTYWLPIVDKIQRQFLSMSSLLYDLSHCYWGIQAYNFSIQPQNIYNMMIIDELDLRVKLSYRVQPSSWK